MRRAIIAAFAMLTLAGCGHRDFDYGHLAVDYVQRANPEPVEERSP